MTTVPARYIGAHSVLLPASNGPYENAEGVRMESLILEPGGTLKIYPHEAWGETIKWDPTGNTQPLILGYGRLLLTGDADPRHEDGTPCAPYSAAELEARGYEFVAPRSDFVALAPCPAPNADKLAEAGLSAVVMTQDARPADAAPPSAPVQAQQDAAPAEASESVVTPDDVSSGVTTPSENPNAELETEPDATQDQ